MNFIGVTHTLGMPPYVPYLDGYWKLGRDYWTSIYTDSGVYHCEMKKGWVTDKRSGSTAVDIIVPKSWNADYDAIILSHDFLYSGHLCRATADWILKEGMIWSGISEWKANLAYSAVRIAGGSAWIDIDLPLPSPYQNNRELEKFTWEPK